MEITKLIKWCEFEIEHKQDFIEWEEEDIKALEAIKAALKDYKQITDRVR